MTKILANDGISQTGIDSLTSKGFHIITEHVAQDDLIKVINKEGYEVLLVRSANSAISVNIPPKLLLAII